MISIDSELIRLDVVDFQLSGNSRAIAHTNLGAITLDPIKVNVTTHLNGFQGLKGMSTIDSVDVTGGISEGINLAIQGRSSLMNKMLSHLNSNYPSYHL